jgi:rhodanese-related sulfurtransferase
VKKTEKIIHFVLLTSLLIVIGFLFISKFQTVQETFFLNSKKALQIVSSEDRLIKVDALKDQNYTLIDIRNQYEFERGHIENSINLPAPQILDEEHVAFLHKMLLSNTPVALYSNSIEEANIPFQILYQMGFNNLSILSIEIDYLQDSMVISSVDIEKQKYDIHGFIEESVKKAKENAERKKVRVNPKPRPVVVTKKKKKIPAEGGC